MESTQDDSMNSSSEEVDQPEQDNNNSNNDVGTGRFYECVFCKRGFNTAQALGGHMNIHRKDRAKNRPSALINSQKREEIYTGPRIYHQISSYPPYYSSVADHHEVASVNYRTHIPASTSVAAVRPSYVHHGGDFYDRNPQLFGTFGDDWRLSLSLQFGPPDEDDKEKKGDVESEEDELDLELRLGHNP